MLAANWTTFDYTTRSQMKSATFVLASQLVPVKKAKKLMGTWGGAEDEFEREWVLAKAADVSAMTFGTTDEQVAVVDHITMLQYFGQHVLAAPEVSHESRCSARG